MSISMNGQSCVPPGFRFHPTEEELLNYYLRKKVASEKIDLDVIRDVDLNKLEPWDIQEKCRIGSGPQNDWYFFSHKDKKYPTGTRTNRATSAGFWKATGRDKAIYNSSKRIGMRKTLVFYKGRAPHGQKSDWIMHEYRLDDHAAEIPSHHSNVPVQLEGDQANQEDGWVICRVFKKKHLHKDLSTSPNNNKCSSSGSSALITGNAKTHMLHSSSDDALDQILQYMGRSCKQEDELNMLHTRSNKHSTRYLRPIDTVLGNGVALAVHDRFMKLPALESPTTVPSSITSSYTPLPPTGHLSNYDDVVRACQGDAAAITDWAMMDRLVASHLNGQSEASKQLASCFEDTGCPFYSATKILSNMEEHNNDSCGGGGSGSNNGGSDEDLWSFARSASSASERLSHVSL